ncbi:hypothetical protein GF386_03855 [Candidatus Pacearchaeota archaeon]|nr:hypothetical protein [Candidatus Pacearchaeota archaeon]MBD3283281.1 hypothetical protein [Candidatus Pacearchaeota archaeon]
MKKKRKKSKLKDSEESKLRKFLKESARDSLAIGSIPMYIIVAARSAVGEYYGFVYQILLAGAILFILSLFLKSQNHIARGMILFAFTSFFYNDKIFTTFASVILILVLVSLLYLKYNKRHILIGVIFGEISSFLSYYILKGFV